MSKLFNEWWDGEGYWDKIKNPMSIAENAWGACKDRAIELLKKESRTSIEKKGRSWEKALEKL